MPKTFAKLIEFYKGCQDPPMKKDSFCSLQKVVRVCTQSCFGIWESHRHIILGAFFWDQVPCLTLLGPLAACTAFQCSNLSLSSFHRWDFELMQVQSDGLREREGRSESLFLLLPHFKHTSFGQLSWAGPVSFSSAWIVWPSCRCLHAPLQSKNKQMIRRYEKEVMLSYALDLGHVSSYNV